MKQKDKWFVAFFLEHMCFKGTIKSPKAIDISKGLDALGSQYNAFTAQEYILDIMLNLTPSILSNL